MNRQAEDETEEADWETPAATSLDALRIGGGRRYSRRHEVSHTVRSANAIAYLDLNGRGTSFDMLLLTRTGDKEYVMMGQRGQKMLQLAAIGSGEVDPREDAEILECAICLLETTGLLQCREWEDTRWDLPSGQH